MTSGQSTSAPRRRRGALLPTLIILVLAVIAFVFFANVYTEILWFNQLGFQDVFWKTNIAKGLIFLAAFVLMFAAVYASIRIAYRARPVYAPDNEAESNLSRYQVQLEPVRKVVMIGVPLVFALFAGVAALGQWQKVLLFFFQKPFGQTDPQFGLDIAFYTNSLPFLGFLSGFLISLVVISGIVGLLTHYLYGAIRIQERGLFASRAAQVQLAVTAGIFLILLGLNFWLDRYGTLQDNGGLQAGAMYTDVNAVIPTKAILAIAAAIVAVLFILSAIIGRWRLPVIGTAMLIITAIVAGGIYPWAIQQFQVVPSQQNLENQYIQRNIDMTRSAYGLSDVEVIPYKATTTATPGALRKDATTAANIRLLDPNLVSTTFQQLEQYRAYYGFPKTLNVDRYTIDGKVQDTVIALRELNPGGIPAAQQTWVNKHLVYTHGYGVVAAYGNTATADGKPVFLQSGVPSNGKLGTDSSYQPRIYFGQNTTDYSIVGAPEGAKAVELDRPQVGDDNSNTLNTFDGNGGPDVGNWFNRLLYSLKFQSTDLLLSDSVNSESQILYDRTPVQRVQKVAPYLTIDGNPYPAVVDGKVKWIVDGYTTSNAYPYSQQQALDSATTDSLTARTGSGALGSGSINYIRNSVKATVDAYDGSVTLYAWDDKDPILKTWESIYPATVKPIAAMSGDLISHVRYPEDLFKVQRELLGRYHVTDAGEFYQNNDAWSVPNDPVEASSAVKQPPYYLSLQMPGQDKPAFSLTSNFIPQTAPGADARNVLYGYLAADADAGNKDGVKADSYGKLRLLSLPTDTLVPAPGQVFNRFVSDPNISASLNILKLGQSQLKNGNLLTLPVGGGLLYVQPVYVQSTGEGSYPTLQRVLVAFGDKIAFAPTLDAALDQLFGGDSGASAGDKGNGTKPGTGTGTGSTPTPGENPTARAALTKALQDASQAIKDGQAALAKGDFASYGTAQKKLSDALAAALAAEGKLGADTSTPSSTASPSSSAVPSASPSGSASSAPTAGSSDPSSSASPTKTP
ncbi:UPF0182 family protein [Psychromicrobium lacuslunae]|uniref:UPF0182 family membrane protein n=1 Tax=Psychromicrobium lacuslunae TaxID=1618207 RepID=UPI0005D454E3|nr:UPF0182 family protein [Psychromicrobium lacuslunae]